MKTLNLLLLLTLACLVTQVNGQSTQELFNVSEQVSIDGLNKDLLYERAKIIFLEKYNHSSNYLKMNKNQGSLAGGGVSLTSISRKTGDEQLYYKIIMVLNDNGYSLKLTDFYYDETKKSGKKVKKFVHLADNDNQSKRNKKLQNQALVIAKEVCDEVRKEMNQIPEADIAKIGGN